MEAEQQHEFNLLKHFSSIKDPRQERGKRHSAAKIFVTSVCAIISGSESWVEVEEFCKSKEEWLGTLIELENGIPSHDTYGRFYSMLDPEELQRCFISWVESLRKHVSGEIVSLDGKTLRRSINKVNGQLPFHIVSAWSNNNKLSLGQVQVDKKSNEIIAIPALLEVLALKGCIVTIDAMGCQKKITACIRKKEADYVLSLKSNQGNLYKRAKLFFEEQARDNYTKLESFRTEDRGHGRLEERQYYFTNSVSCLKPCDGWADLQSIGMIIAKRTVNGKTTTKKRYFISSLPQGSVRNFAKAVRQHWGIENSLHWVLDVCLREDESRVRVGYAAQNLAMLRKIALNLIKQDTTSKKSFRVRKMKVTWSQSYAMAVLFQKKVSHTA